ncbi:hypothetical protein PPERSA_06919 [Pseudocohnilembus persalinus]|uniref:Uncharacterized protein n=1 Tax=Pseudocohnilembus persalinus TaxID=266149 RepID=A0A0V0QZI6_PSEPJ|nr:hypothetical protein PPERSA_06919 [Pseudocohnilembus persalinus]|eukprot:KRX07304.1 hypothetical protein PPERSA_06919 [Pseudocohnilembus persalinus]
MGMHYFKPQYDPDFNCPGFSDFFNIIQDFDNEKIQRLIANLAQTMSRLMVSKEGQEIYSKLEDDQNTFFKKSYEMALKSHGFPHDENSCITLYIFLGRFQQKQENYKLFQELTKDVHFIKNNMVLQYGNQLINQNQNILKDSNFKSQQNCEVYNLEKGTKTSIKDILIKNKGPTMLVVLIYISEAHTDDLWPIGKTFQINNKNVNCKSYNSLEERKQRAQEFKNLTNCPYEIYYDDENNNYNKLFQAWPDKSYFVQSDGLIIQTSKIYKAVHLEDCNDILLNYMNQIEQEQIRQIQQNEDKNNQNQQDQASIN